MTRQEAIIKRPKDRGDRILAAAARLFADRGYHAVSIADIGEAVGITGPAVYRHYASKEDLALAAATQAATHLVDAYNAELAKGGSAEERVERVARSVIRATLEERDITAVYLREAGRIPADRRMVLRDVQREETRIRFETLGVARPDLGPEVVRVMASAVSGLALSVLFYQPRISRKRLEDLLTSMACAALLRSWRGSAVLPVGDIDPGTSTELADGGHSGGSSRREVIMASAARLFRESGYSGVGIDGIGAAAGISGPAVYGHFRSKQDILEAVFTRTVEQLSADASRSLLTSRTPADALTRLAWGYADLVVHNENSIVVHLTEVHELEPDRQLDVHGRLRSYRDEWLTVLRMLRPELPDAEARMMLFAALGIANGYALGSLRLRRGQAAALLTNMITNALLQG